MQVLTATGAHNGGISKVVIKEANDFNRIIVTDPETSHEFLLCVTRMTQHRLVQHAQANGLTAVSQLVGAELTPECPHGADWFYVWRVQRGV
jgi:hypothetical protein